MDILALKSKTEYEYEIIKIINDLKFKKYPIELKGSSSLKSQRFFSDYDLFSNISGKISGKTAYLELKNILNKLKKDKDIYFIEMKLQKKNGEKIKLFKNDPFKGEDFVKHFDSLDFVKIDLIAYIKNIFTEISIIYKFSNEKMDKKSYILSLNEDIKELIKEGRYYKVLKRLFNIFKLQNKTDKLLYLNEIFNSELGILYQKISNLEAIDKILNYYKDALTLKKIRVNLKDIKEPLSLKSIRENIIKYSNALNKQSKKIYEEII